MAQRVFRAGVSIMRNGRPETVDVYLLPDDQRDIAAKAEVEGIPLHLLLADWLWHAVAHKLGTDKGWTMPPVDGHTLPLPRANGERGVSEAWEGTGHSAPTLT
jgi:hypothetical protein